MFQEKHGNAITKLRGTFFVAWALLLAATASLAATPEEHSAASGVHYQLIESYTVESDSDDGVEGFFRLSSQLSCGAISGKALSSDVCIGHSRAIQPAHYRLWFARGAAKRYGYDARRFLSARHRVFEDASAFPS